MSGHSKWANIKRKKEANDKVKGSMFSKLGRLISLAVSEGGGITDPTNNVRLRIAIEKAKSFNMPKNNIERAIEKGSGKGVDNIREVIYEAFGPGGTAMVIVAATDNPNRTASEVRNVLDRHGAKLGSKNAVMYLFEKSSFVRLPRERISEQQAFDFAQTHGAIDFAEDAENYFLYFPYELFGKLHETLPISGVHVEIVYKPQTMIGLTEEVGQKLVTLVQALEDMDDIQNVFHNGN